MPLYLDEIYLNAPSAAQTKQALKFFADTIKGGLPPGVTLKAGPWMSNEEAKIILVLDIKDHSLTFNPFTKALAQGLVTRRRLFPIVDWGEALKLVDEL